MKTKPAPMLTVKEVAQELAISQKTVRRRISDQTLPASRVGPRMVRIAAEDVARFKAAGKTC